MQVGVRDRNGYTRRKNTKRSTVHSPVVVLRQLRAQDFGVLPALSTPTKMLSLDPDESLVTDATTAVLFCSLWNTMLRHRRVTEQCKVDKELCLRGILLQIPIV